MKPNRKTNLLALLGLLALSLLITPSASADLGEWFQFDQAPPFYDGGTVRTCLPDGVNSDSGYLTISERGYVQGLGGGVFDISPPAGSGDQQPRHYELDEEGCVSFHFNESVLVGYNGPSTYALNYTDAALGNQDRLIMIQVLPAPVVEQNSTVTSTATLSGGASDVFEDLAPKAFFLAFALVFLFNGWTISGTFFLLAAVLQEVVSGFAVSEAWLYVAGALFALFEWLIFNKWPQFHANLKARIVARDGVGQ